MGNEPKITEQKKRGRPPKKKNEELLAAQGESRMLRVIDTPRQDRLLRKLQAEWGLSESEHVRRALDDYLRLLVERGELKE